jgi:hypothetical protein
MKICELIGKVLYEQSLEKDGVGKETGQKVLTGILEGFEKKA